MQRIYLAVVGGIFAASGLWACIDPLATAEFLGITAVDLSGETEIRATYGGLVLGIGLLMLCGVRWRRLALAGLACVVFGVGALVATRLVVEVFFGGPGIAWNQGIIIAFELIVVLAALLLFRQALAEQVRHRDDAD